MTAGRRAVLFAAVFFATAGVLMWSMASPAPVAFVAGAGWTVVLAAISDWERSLERPVEPRARVVALPRPVTSGARKQASEDYRLNHDVHDPATLPCRYGCREPVTCPFPHADCPHCLDAREAADETVAYTALRMVGHLPESPPPDGR